MRQITKNIESPVIPSCDPHPPQELLEAVRIHQHGHVECAEKIYSEFLGNNPSHAQALALLATCLAQKGRFQEADALLMQSIQSAPQHAYPRYCRAEVLVASGQTEHAVSPYSYALALGHPDAGERLENVLTILGDKARAHSHRILTGFYVSNNMLEPALLHSVKLVGLEPDSIDSWRIFSRILSRVRFTSKVSNDLLDNMVMAFSQPGLDYQLFAGAAISALMHEDYFVLLEKSFQPPRNTHSLFAGDEIKRLENFPLFRQILSRVLVNNVGFERFLTTLRGELLRFIYSNGKVIENHHKLISWLAHQCFLNGYLWPVSQEEQAILNQLDKNIEVNIKSTAIEEKSLSVMIALQSMYQPLYKSRHADWMECIQWPDEVSEIIKQQLLEPLEEHRLSEKIPAISSKISDTSMYIREQYEERPYPRWMDVPLYNGAVSLEQYIQQNIPGYESDANQFLSPDLLVAGCGTGKAANYLAQHIKGSKVTALDLSLSGLAYAMRKSKQLGLDSSVEYLQGDILDLPSLGRKFHHINCYGVLHHLDDIGEGFRALAACLQPNGSMQIGIYGENSQKPLLHASNFIRGKFGECLDIDTVRKSRQAIIDKGDDTLLQPLLEAPNFYNLDDFWNLVVRYQESYISLSWLEKLLPELGLEFIGFQHNDPTVTDRYSKQYPGDPKMKNLSNWAEFEFNNPDTFRSIYNIWLIKPA